MRLPTDPFTNSPLTFPLTFMLTHGLNGSEYSTLLLLLAAMRPLVATDSRLLNPANAGRPLSGGDVAGFDGSTQYGRASVAGLSTAQTFTISAWVYKPDNLNSGFNVIWSSSGVGGTRVRFNSMSNRVYVVSTDTGYDAPLGVWNHIAVDYELGNAVRMRANGVEEWTGSASSTNENFLNIAAQSDGITASSHLKGRVVDVQITGDVTATYPLGETTGTTAYDSSGNGNHGTYVNNPTLNVPDNTVPYSAWNQLGGTVGTGSNGAAIGVRIPRNESNTAQDVLSNAVQYSGTAYPVLPDITGGTAAALTAFNTNISTASTQPPEILAAAIPATWVHADGSVPVLQVKDNGDSTSSLALGLPDAPTAPEQLTIDEYYA